MPISRANFWRWWDGGDVAALPPLDPRLSGPYLNDFRAGAGSIGREAGLRRRETLGDAHLFT